MREGGGRDLYDGMYDRAQAHVLVSDAECARLADRRLRARLAMLTSKLAVSPSLSFPRVFSGAELEAAYRFFGNALVTPDAILDGHFESTRRAGAAEAAVLVVHDSSTFAFDPDGEREGLGRLRVCGQAFFAHVTLALADDSTRRPLGLAALSTWVRDDSKSFNEKDRWWQGVQRATERLGAAPNLIHVMDREADDYALFAKMIAAQYRFIVRASHDRVLLGGTREAPAKLSQTVSQIDCVVLREATLSKRKDAGRSPKQKKIHPARGRRTARLSVGYTRISLRRPESQSKEFAASLDLNVVRVWEATPPEDESPVEWLLVTSESIESGEDALRVVDRYRARWTIEEYFKALKTGCAFPDRQLGDYEGLINALAVFAPIACRLLALRSQAQHDADAPASRVLDNDELDVLRNLGRTSLSDHPTAREVLLAVAALGGHIKYGGEPGWHTIGRGFERLMTLTRGWRAGRLQLERDQR